MTKRTRNLITSLTMLCVAVLLGGVIVEVILRVDGRYDDLTGDNFVPSAAIWDRGPNDRQSQRHPDLGYDVELIYNDLGIRNHAGIDKNYVENFKGNIVGFFGDSFTENRRIEDAFTFTSILQKSVDSDRTLILNLGVDGYGLDQSFLKYRSFPSRTIDDVFYVFFKNDLQNLYETQLFDFSDGNAITLRPRRIAWYVGILRRLHITYFLIESFYRLRALGGGLDLAGDDLGQKAANVGQRLFSRDGGRNERYHDRYADEMVSDLLSGHPSERTRRWAANFRRLLEIWRREVEEDGGQFAVIVLPHRNGSAVARALFASTFQGKVMFLGDHFEGDFADYRFRKDPHWNEPGNLIAARIIGRWGDGVYWRFDESRFATVEADIRAKIEALYRE